MGSINYLLVSASSIPVPSPVLIEWSHLYLKKRQREKHLSHHQQIVLEDRKFRGLCTTLEIPAWKDEVSKHSVCFGMSLLCFCFTFIKIRFVLEKEWVAGSFSFVLPSVGSIHLPYQQDERVECSSVAVFTTWWKCQGNDEGWVSELDGERPILSDTPTIRLPIVQTKETSSKHFLVHWFTLARLAQSMIVTTLANRLVVALIISTARTTTTVNPSLLPAVTLEKLHVNHTQIVDVSLKVVLLQIQLVQICQMNHRLGWGTSHVIIKHGYWFERVQWANFGW